VVSVFEKRRRATEVGLSFGYTDTVIQLAGTALFAVQRAAIMERTMAGEWFATRGSLK
jgi:hypothetical protein